MKTPKITVLMTVYNSESYINEAIDSILNQTISDFEFLIIDDGSTDNSVSLIKQYNDARINLVVKEKNSGLIDSLNLGLSLATGQYIARMDSDDISLPTRFEKQLAVLENNSDIKVCGCWLQNFGDNNFIVKHKEHHGEIVANMLVHCSMTMPSVLFDKKALEKYQFSKDKVHVEDYDFWSRIAWSCKLYNIQEVLYFYRVHSAQISKVYNDIQKKSDVPIKLFLFKKITYNTALYTDTLITKMLLRKDFIEVNEFYSFLKWLKELKHLNKNDKAYAQKELEQVLKTIKQKLLFKIYFTNAVPGITKQWRQKALWKLDVIDAIWILNGKKREWFKSLFK